MGEIVAARSQPCMFRITPFSTPGLDDYLQDSGYDRMGDSVVLRISISRNIAPPSSSLVASDILDWSDTYASWHDLSREALSTLREMLGAVPSPSLRGLLLHRDRPVACGMAVVVGRFLGLFDIASDPAHRRRGYGSAMVTELLRWGARQGATETYLQVVANNHPALQLYAKLGFEWTYDYWYRVNPRRAQRAAAAGG